MPDPWDVSVIDSSTVIVSLPTHEQLQVVQVFPHIQAGRIIQVDKKCWGVEVSNNEIYITCHNQPGEGEVRILDMNGTLKRRLGIGWLKSFKFNSPYYITVNESSVKIFVSDWYANTITCMAKEGRILYRYGDAGMKAPRGLYCDSGDMIFVCGEGSHNIHVVSADGKRNSTLPISRDGLFSYPCSVTYKIDEDLLVVGCYESNGVLLLLKLSE